MGPGWEWPLAPNTSIRRQIGTVIFFLFLLFAIEAPRPVRAGDDTIFASDTPPKILHDNTVFTTICCLGRTDGHAWSMITMHTRHRDEFGIHLRIFPVGHGNDLIPENISSQFFAHPAIHMERCSRSCKPLSMLGSQHIYPDQSPFPILAFYPLSLRFINFNSCVKKSGLPTEGVVIHPDDLVWIHTNSLLPFSIGGMSLPRRNSDNALDEPLQKT